MIDFSQHKDIEINGQKLMMWLSSEHYNTYLWKREPEYPYLTIGATVSLNKNRVILTNGFTDKYKLLAATSRDPLSYSGHIGFEIETSGDADPSGNSYEIRKGTVFKAYAVRNDEEYRDFLSGNIEDYEISDAEWSLSDVETGQIKLYATNEPYREDRIGRLSYCVYGHSYAYDVEGSLKYWPTPYYELRKHDTDATAAAGTPLITLNSKNGSPEVTAIRANFDEYKTKYDIVTAGQFPQRTYPYLRGDIKIDCASHVLGIKETWGMYASFMVRR